MIYRSNLDAPDLTPYFRHLVSRPMGHSFGHDVPSDWGDYPDDDPVIGLYKRCGLWTHDEASILYQTAKRHIAGPWADIGAHTGWTAMHIAQGLRERPHDVAAVDPMLRLDVFLRRLEINTPDSANIVPVHLTSREFFTRLPEHQRFAGYCIDGDHQPGEPCQDARSAYAHSYPDTVYVFHDGVGEPVREAVALLMDKGLRARMYLTPHVIFLCWRDECGFRPVDHTPDPFIVSQDLPARMPDFKSYLRRLV